VHQGSSRRKVRPTQHEVGLANRRGFYGQIGTALAAGQKITRKNFVPGDGGSPPDDIFVTPLPAGGCLPT
jgi:hypothetical protein